MEYNRKLLKEQAKATIKPIWGMLFLGLLIVNLLTIATSWLIVGFVLVGPIQVGLTSMFLKARREGNVDINEIFGGFNNFLRNFLAIFLKSLFIALWTLLLVVPGIIKTYSYAMTSYIAAENQELTATECITKSREMMKGHKWDLFVLNLSFIGWGLLAVLTLGILYIWLLPYMEMAMTEFYLTIKGGESQEMPALLEAEEVVEL